MGTFSRASPARPTGGNLMLLGVCAIIFGILALAWPKLTFAIFLIIFGVYAIMEGLVLIASAFYQRKAPTLGDYGQALKQLNGGWWVTLGEGVLSIACGVFCLFAPLLSAQILLIVVAFWALMTGISLLIHAFARGWWLAIIGVLAVIVSFFLFFQPVGSVKSILWMVGVFALIMGALLLVQGWRDRSIQRIAATSDLPAM